MSLIWWWLLRLVTVTVTHINCVSFIWFPFWISKFPLLRSDRFFFLLLLFSFILPLFPLSRKGKVHAFVFFALFLRAFVTALFCVFHCLAVHRTRPFQFLYVPNSSAHLYDSRVFWWVPMDPSVRSSLFNQMMQALELGEDRKSVV